MHGMADEAKDGRVRTRVAELLAKDAIRETLYRELDAQRRRDWAAVRACWVPGARAELGFDAEPSAEAQLERLAEAMRGFTASSLLASNCVIELEPGGAAARSSALVLAAHEPPASRDERTQLEALRYADAWTRDETGGWRIAGRRVESLWRAWLEPRRDDHAGDHRQAAEWER